MVETNKIILGDCIEELKKLPDNSVDAIITDPPYGLEFMGKEWDSFIQGGGSGWKAGQMADTQSLPDGNSFKEKGFGKMPVYRGMNEQQKINLQTFCESWAKEALRVLKPGGYLLSFGGTRTYHRMTCGIEDAGFEIRDCIMWLYSTGFPKSLNVKKQLEKVYKGGNTSINHNGKQETEYNLRPLSETDLQETINAEDKQREVLQSGLSEQSSYKTMQGQESQERTLGKEQSSMERRSNLLQDKGELQRCEICKMSKEVSCYVPKGWLYYGTPINNGEEVKEGSIKNGSSASHRPQSSEQQDRESYAVCEQCRTQILRTFEGIGTALKPACEPIVVARKPLSEKNVALNVLKWGTGGINIDESRIGNEERTYKGMSAKQPELAGTMRDDNWIPKDIETTVNGRFPANIILDEEAGNLLNHQVGQEVSRFFYIPKASKSERNFGCEELEEKRGGSMKANTADTMQLGGASLKGTPKEIQSTKNNHPTVKPIKLMEYLIKLVSREGAVILDPFLGSGTTAVACLKTNRNFIGIEKESDYVKIAEARIKPYLEQKKLA